MIMLLCKVWAPHIRRMLQDPPQGAVHGLLHSGRFRLNSNTVSHIGLEIDGFLRTENVPIKYDRQGLLHYVSSLLYRVGPFYLSRGLLTVAHFRQRGFSLRQPEGHVHGAVQLDGGVKFDTGKPAPAHAAIQGAETEVAVGLERTHAQLIGQGEGLAVVFSNLLAHRGLAPHRNVTEEVQSIRLVATFVVRTDMRQRPLGKDLRLLQAAS